LSPTFHSGIDSLTDDQRNNAIGKAAAEFQNFYDWQAAPILPLTSSKTEARENCDSCSRILKNEFFRGSNTASVIMTQISHFNILIEDESMFQSLGAASKGFKVSILNMIVRTMLQIASASSKHTHWSNRSVAMVAALFAKRIDSEFGIGFEAANEDTTLKEIELFLLEEGTRESMRAAVTGALRNDTLVMEKFPPVDSMPDNHLIISPKWVATMYEEMEKIFREKFASDKKIGGASLESSLWSICGVIDAGATRQLGKFKPPPKPRAKRTDAAASTSENDQLNVAIEGEAAEKDKRVDSKNSKKASAGGKGRGTARPEPSTSKKQTKKKTNAVPDASRQEVEEEIEGQEEKEEALENPSTTLQQLQPTNTLASRRPSRAAARAAGARVAVMAVDSLAFQAEQAMQASTTRKRARDGNAMPTEPVQSTTSPVSNVI
jgi:hypothetical protein